MGTRSQNKISPLFLDRLRYIFFGYPLKNSEAPKERLGFVGAFIVFALDALSSIVYATEEIILALMVGPNLSGFSFFIALMIVVLMVLLIASYYQTVFAFPQGGGAYTVAKIYLGKSTSLVAAAALLLDYVLTVAVSVAAGVRAFVSVFPSLRHNDVIFALSMMTVLCWANLRGIRASVHLLALPVFIFILGFCALGIMGVSTSFALNLWPQWPGLENLNVFSCFILLKAFSSGCTAMTGIEAIANAGSVLEKPHARTGQMVLIGMGVCLAGLFLSTTWTAQILGIYPLQEESLISQITKYFWGNGWLHAVFQFVIAGILFLAANTAFADFPKLASILAEDGWLPRHLSARGDRLVFSYGILLLSGLSMALIFIFQGNVHHLIPLYAVGVFIAFILNQVGMGIHWYRLKKKHQIRMSLNLLGAFFTAVALAITLQAKFFQGAYLIIVMIPLLCGIFLSINRHYQHVDDRLQVDFKNLPSVRTFSKTVKTPVLVPVSRFHRGALEACFIARQLSSDVTVVIVEMDHIVPHEAAKKIQSLEWGIKVHIIPSPYRSIAYPLLTFISNLDEQKKMPVLLIFPELSVRWWWQKILHNQTARSVQKAVRAFDAERGISRTVLDAPYFLNSPLL